MLKLPVYLDYNATTPVDPRVLETMLPYFSEYFGNAASRTHAYGWEADEAVEYARSQAAQLVGAEVKELIFTSGATEAVNLAIKGVLEMYASKGNHVVTCATEHKAVLDTCKHAEKNGASVTYLPVNNEGLIDLQQLEAAITGETVLIAIMYANNETGVVQPIAEIGAIARRHGVLFFTDATQAVGKIPVDVNRDNIDILAFSAHKFYGPKGVGGLFVRRKNPRVKITAQLDGGGHERGIRSGTLNVPGIVGLGKACELCRLEMEEDSRQVRILRDKLEEALLQLPDTFLNGSPEQRLPHVCNISFSNVESSVLMMGFGKNIAVSSGSACTSATMEPSYVLKALGLSDEMAYSSLRFSLGRFTTEEQVNYAIDQVKQGISQLRIPLNH
ncbi:IscS subfamily cysteine desulfurase [Deminuibacter soli]|uniref:cysteine desulfurase n=1 Tax=Deminuibacter soli TaxID=2291815 RepID=A0A3E1NP55_9BACT|nr:IscS subfamily cysteine desulfurase [Deminuibacter soli]RFM29703.1 IscS subfamily cysteine desulfurase [Deminuibacter soli]